MENEIKTATDLSLDDVKKVFDILLNNNSSKEILNFPICVSSNTTSHFIEVTERDYCTRVMLPIEKILSISEYNGHCFIETGVDNKGESLGMFCTQSYDEVCALLKDSNNSLLCHVVEMIKKLSSMK